MDLALNKPQRLICHKTQQTKPNTPTSLKNIYTLDEYFLTRIKSAHYTCKYV